MLKFLKQFRQNDDGAMMVDWVVLTAAVIGLGFAAYGSIKSDTQQTPDQTETRSE